MHYPDTRWRPCCQGKSRDDVSGRIENNRFINLPIVKRGKESKLGTVGVPITRWSHITKA